MNIIQFLNDNNTIQVGIVKDFHTIQALGTSKSCYELCQEAIAKKTDLKTLIARLSIKEEVSYQHLCDNQKLLPPITLQDTKKITLSGTGLTHLGSGDARDKMHTKEDNNLTDSKKMFNLGLEGGKPKNGALGVQPEWFYKGDGSILKSPNQDIVSPSFALDGGEEPELVGVYINDNEGNTYRVGFSIGNEFSDHITEKQNYLYLAHSKLRECSVGAELFLGEIPKNIQGKVSIYRGEAVVWEKPFLTGEDNMSHSIDNLEYHHFKYKQFRQKGDVHFHFFGTSILSFADGVSVRNHDQINIEADIFTRPLHNRIVLETQAEQIKIHSL